MINLFSSEKNDSRDAIDGIAILNEVRALGGLVEALKKGWVQDRVDSEASAARPKEVLGVNLYPLDGEELPEGMKASKRGTRAAHQQRHKDKEIEPLRAVRWAAELETERHNSK